MMKEFVPASEHDGKAVFAMLLNKVNAFKDEELKAIVKDIMLQNREALEVFPAAYRLHHAIVGGLMLHTASIVEMAEKTCEVYPNINRELLLAGAILHDVAKTFEMNTGKTGLCTGYTVGGELIGHLVKGAMMVNDTAKKLGISSETVTLLEHMILSHHGIPEYGPTMYPPIGARPPPGFLIREPTIISAPTASDGIPEYGAAVRPMFLEAEILSTLDSLDATIFEFNSAASKVEPGEFSDRQWMLDNRKVFNHGLAPSDYKVNLGE